MKIAKIIALVGLIAMTGILIYGFTIGNFSEEGAKLLAMPWGISAHLRFPRGGVQPAKIG